MKKMRFEEFAKAVVEKIREYLPESFADATVELQTIMKNNAMQLTGLTIRTNENGACPLIYLDQFFKEYEAGEDMSKLLKQIADIRIKNDVLTGFDVDEITDFDCVKDKVVPRLINRKWNASLLSDKPYTEIADLAVTYHIRFSDEFSVPVTDSLMETWGVETKDLYDLSICNMRRVLPSSFRGMSAVLFGADADAEIDPADETLFVLTNAEGVMGAAAVLDEEIMKQAVETLGEHLIVIPSSVHEMLLLAPSPDIGDVARLEDMIRSANDSVVSPDERLGEHAYIYSLRDGLQIAI